MRKKWLEMKSCTSFEVQTDIDKKNRFTLRVPTTQKQTSDDSPRPEADVNRNRIPKCSSPLQSEAARDVDGDHSSREQTDESEAAGDSKRHYSTPEPGEAQALVNSFRNVTLER